MSDRPDWSEWILQKNSEAKQEELKKDAVLIVRPLKKANDGANLTDEDLLNIVNYSQNDQEKAAAANELNQRKTAKISASQPNQASNQTRVAPKKRLPQPAKTITPLRAQPEPQASQPVDEVKSTPADHPYAQFLNSPVTQKLINVISSKDPNVLPEHKEIAQKHFDERLDAWKRGDISNLNQDVDIAANQPKVVAEAATPQELPAVFPAKRQHADQRPFPNITRNGIKLSQEEAEKYLNEMKGVKIQDTEQGKKIMLDRTPEEQQKLENKRKIEAGQRGLTKPVAGIAMDRDSQRAAREQESKETRENIKSAEQRQQAAKLAQDIQSAQQKAFSAVQEARKKRAL